MKQLFTIILGIFCWNLQAQFVTHGPIVGNVSYNGFGIYYRTQSPGIYELQLDTSAQFTTPILVPFETFASKDNSGIVRVNGLLSHKKYYYRLLNNGVTDTAHTGFVKTFPSENDSTSLLTFVTGSCQETPNMKVFDVMRKISPDFLMHTGDFTYPSYQIQGNYPDDWSLVELSYRKRYSEVKMKELLRETAIDYMPDDDDNWGSGFIGTYDYAYQIDSANNVTNTLVVDTVTQQARTNCLRGYRYFFPGYAVIDTTEGHYHSFRMGNCEFFVTDTRSMSDLPTQAFVMDSLTHKWKFQPPVGHTILGANQRNWLLNSLSASTADWKFIVSGVPFNPKLKKLIDIGVLFQNQIFTIAGNTGTGFKIALSFANYWAGYPEDVQAIVNHIQANQIKGVAVISGDTHHNVMDDGTNSVFPELNASGLSVTTTELAYQIAQYAGMLGQPPVEDSLWNAGGNGLHNTNFKNAFGKVDVWGKDSVRFCVISEDSVALSCFTMYNNGQVNNPYYPTAIISPTVTPLKIYPNPVSGKIVTIELPWNYNMKELTNLKVTDSQGKNIPCKVTPQGKKEVKLEFPQSTNNGTYFLFLQSNNGIHMGKVMIN